MVACPLLVGGRGGPVPGAAVPVVASSRWSPLPGVVSFQAPVYPVARNNLDASAGFTLRAAAGHGMNSTEGARSEAVRLHGEKTAARPTFPTQSTTVVCDPAFRRVKSNSACERLAGPDRLDAMHGMVVEKARAARLALEMSEPLDKEAICQAAVLDGASHLDRTALRTWKRFRCRYFSSRRRGHRRCRSLLS